MSETRTGKTAFAFPGTGIKPCGREAPFFARHERILRPLLDEASQIAGADLAGELAAGRVEHLPDDRNQFFTYAFGAGICRVLDEAGIRPDLAAGYSFGIYGALVAAGAASFGDGLRMVRRAFDLMAGACRGTEAGMAAIVGLGRDDVEALLAGRPGAGVHLAITNSDLCHVLSSSSPT
jgi:[acyl-carrier-protein] S-malonyltransferase